VSALFACLFCSLCSEINSTLSPASGAGNVSELRLLSQVGTVRVDQCVYAIRAGGSTSVVLLT